MHQGNYFLFNGTRRTGFTLVEVLLVIALLGLLTGLAIPFYQTFQVSSQLDTAVAEVVQTLRRAQGRAMASEGFSAFGVQFDSGSFTLFQGTTYTAGDPFNETTDLPGTLSLVPSGGSAVVFNHLEGRASGTTILTISTSNGEARTITINAFGTVDEQ